MDSLRAFAVGIVMIHHFRDQPFFLSGFGASLFLVLSGYFATKTLLRLREESQSGQIDAGAALKSFYLQRGLRLFPLYYLVLLLALLFRVEYARSTFLWNATFLSNFRVWSTGEWPGRFSPLWSLSLLEQFYLVWPAVILFVPQRHLARVTLGAILVAPAYRLLCFGMGWGPVTWCVAPMASLDQLGSGALLALCGSKLVSPKLGQALMAFAGKFCLPAFALILAMKAWGHTPPGCAIYVNLVASLAFLWVVKKAETGFQGGARVVMENPLLGYIGRISYSIFLLHTFAELLVPRFAVLRPLMHSDWRALILIPTTLLLAHVSYCLIEYPISRYRKRLAGAKAEQQIPVPDSVLA